MSSRLPIGLEDTSATVALTLLSEAVTTDMASQKRRYYSPMCNDTFWCCTVDEHALTSHIENLHANAEKFKEDRDYQALGSTLVSLNIAEEVLELRRDPDVAQMCAFPKRSIEDRCGVVLNGTKAGRSYKGQIVFAYDEWIQQMPNAEERLNSTIARIAAITGKDKATLLIESGCMEKQQ